MSFPAQQQSLRTRVFGTNWQPVVVGLVVTAVIAAVGFFIGRADLRLTSPGVGGLVGGFHYGKNTGDSAGLGLRIGMVSVALATGGAVSFVVFRAVYLGETEAAAPLPFVLYYGLGYLLVGGLLATIGGAVGTNLRRILVPHEYNPPLH